MKPYLLMLIQMFLIFVMGCDTKTRKESIKESVGSKSNFSDDKLKDLVKEGYSIQKKEDYLSDKLLIAKKGKLKGYKSLNIKGHQLYKLDEQGNIIETYDISNNYSIYTYDQKNRLVKSENKQHTPPEVYYDVAYKYSKADSVVEIKTTSYKNNEPIKTDIKRKDIALSEKDVKRDCFENKKNIDVYINPEKDIMVVYEDELIFCCGNIMNGKNKLIYHVNENELIDSLIIIGMESGKRMKFEYEYE